MAEALPIWYPAPAFCVLHLFIVRPSAPPPVGAGDAFLVGVVAVPRGPGCDRIELTGRVML